MKPFVRLAPALAAVFLGPLLAQDSGGGDGEAGWTSIFDGETLHGWMTSAGKPSRVPVEDGAINPHGCGDYMLVYDQPLGSFVLAVDFKISAGCNSGIFVRTASLVPRPGRDVGWNGLEIAIDDTSGAGYTDTGALYDLSPPGKNAMKTGSAGERHGQWNRFEITCDGPRITVALNGEKVNDVDLSTFTRPGRRPDGSPHKFDDFIYRDHPWIGYVGLQDHGRPCWFKNIRIKALAERTLSALESSGIWGESILAQPFDREPFREIKIPAWVEETCGLGYTLSVISSEEREKAARGGIVLSEIGFVDPLYAYYDSKLLARRSPHVPPDRLEKDIAEYRRLGVRLLAVYPPSLQGEVYAAHPDWRRVAEPSAAPPQVDLAASPQGGMLCLLGPYGDFFIEVLAEILSKFQVDAFSFDGLHYGGVCYCEHCRAAYRAELGGAIPAVDLEDPAFRRYQHWADRRMERTVQKMQARLKGIKPDVALVTWTTNAGRFGHFRDIPRNMPARMNLLLDAPDQEFWLDETNRGATVVPALANAYIHAVTNHRVAFSEPYLMAHGNPYGKDSFPGHEVLRRMLLSVTWGVRPSIAVLQPEPLQGAVFAALREVAARKPWLTHTEPEPWAAVLLSDNSRVFYGRSPAAVEEKYLASVLGFFRALLEAHLPFVIVNDWNLTAADLARYKVLVLPNAACLGDEQVSAVRAYVAQGGGLVASLDASLYDELGTPRPDFALADVFGVAYKGIPRSGGSPEDEVDVHFARGVDASYWEKRRGLFDFRPAAGGAADTPGLRTLVRPDEPVTYKGAALRVEVEAANARVAGTITPRGTGGASPHAAIVTREHGRGKVAYLASAFDAANYLYAYPYHRPLLAGLVRWASSGPPPVEVEAPMCVHAAVYRQRREGERLLVHLYNDVNTTAFHALPGEDVPLREETLPIHDIIVRFLEPHAIRGVHLEPGGLALSTRVVGESLEVTVPRLDVHAIVVAEM
jgi:hypothetical protein